MIRRNPIIGQMRLNFEYNIHVIQYRHISVKVTHSVILRQLKNTKFRPRIRKSLSDKRHLHTLRREKMLALAKDHVAFWRLELKNALRIFGEVGRVEHYERVD